ncbi:MAG: hypothetical protein ACE5IK_06515 [Acidobacteriota bacterium]
MMSRLERSVLLAATVLAGGSGLILHVMKRWMSPADAFAVVNHPWQPFVLKLHVVSVPFLVLVLGMTMAGHAKDRFLAGRRRGRRTGVAVAVLVVPMIATGVLIQVLMSDPAIRMMAWAHLATGGIFLAVYVVHHVVTPSPGPRPADLPAVPAPPPSPALRR